MKAREPLATIWMAPCTAMAVPTGRMASRIPSKTSPPAMPNTPDKVEVPNTASSNAALTHRLTHFTPAVGALHALAWQAVPEPMWQEGVSRSSCQIGKHAKAASVHWAQVLAALALALLTSSSGMSSKLE